jgi:hypothetical protein
MTIEQLVNLLVANLKAQAPKDSGNMADNIIPKEFDDRWEIRIAAGVPYSYYVNYNWGNRDAKSKQEYEAKGLHKEKENYQWVERCIQATSETLVGKGSVNSGL